METLLPAISGYREIFLLLFEVVLFVILYIVGRSLYRKWKEENTKARNEENKKLLTNGHFKGALDEADRQNAIRQMVAPDGVNPGYDTYLSVSDGGREVFVRSVTLSKLPKKVKYAETLRPLFQYPNCTCTCFVEPIDSAEMSRMLDRQIDILGVEELTEKGNVNRVRRLGHQVDEVTRWADQVDVDDKKFFYVGFLFTLYAETVEQLNDITDSFRMLAVNKKMDISNCYCVQSEAYLANMPFNRVGNVVFKKMDSDAVKMHLMDQGAVSVILNYTQDYFTHKRGVPLGRNLFNGMPFVFDIYDPSHDGYTVIMCGKTRSGKSSTIKMMMERLIPQGYRFVAIDSQTRKGTSGGEYAAVTQINGGINFQISSKNENTLNIFQLQESTEFIKTAVDSGYERRTLDLNGAITEILCNLRTMIYNGGATDEDMEENQSMDLVFDSEVMSILTDCVKELFSERGIVHDNAESLYEEGTVIKDGLLQSGFVPKKLPTITKLYQKILTKKWKCQDEKTLGAFKYILNNLRENVRELYYVESSKRFFTKEEVDSMPYEPGGSLRKVYVNEEDELEPVIEIKGIRPYFDGQSNLMISKECQVVNIDISQLKEKERKVAREIAIHFLNEQFIKKNSENLEFADKLCCIVDEAHESFAYKYGRTTFANVTRTAAKRYVSMIYSTQTVAEFDRYEETRDIMRQAAVKMIFKQDGQDRELLERVLNITQSQANIITNMIGVVTDKEDPQARSRHRGEICVIDGEQVLFVKVDYLRKTEELAVETDASMVMQAIKKAG